MSGNSLRDGRGRGLATVTVTATDPEGLSVGQDLSVTVAFPLDRGRSIWWLRDGTSGTVRGRNPSPAMARGFRVDRRVSIIMAAGKHR